MSFLTSSVSTSMSLSFVAGSLVAYSCSHSVHHLLALYALGAPGPVISAAYQDTHLDHLRIAFVPPKKVTITDDNFTDYLGNDQCVLMSTVSPSR